MGEVGIRIYAMRRGDRWDKWDMASSLLKLSDLGFTAHGCYRNGDCDRCAAKNLLTWFWHSKWVCDNCVLNNLLPEPSQPEDDETGEYSLSPLRPEIIVLPPNQSPRSRV